MIESMNKRFGNEGIMVTAYESDGEIYLKERDADTPLAVLEQDQYKFEVRWLRQSILKGYTRNRFEFQLFHIVRDYEMRISQHNFINTELKGDD